MWKPASVEILVAILASSAWGQARESVVVRRSTIEEVRAIKVVEADQGPRVAVRGVVTYRRKGGHLFLQDGRSAIFIQRQPGAPIVSPGDHVEVEGKVHPGFASYIVESRIRVLRHGPIPSPLEPSFEDLAASANHCHWVEIRGIVRAAARESDGAFHLTLSMGGGRVHGWTYGVGDPGARNLVGARVRLRGALGGRFNDQRQIVAPIVYFNDLGDVVIERAAADSPESVARRPVNTLRRFLPEPIDNVRVRVAGVVTCRQSGRIFYLQDETGGLRIQASEEALVQPGDLVEVVGFLAMGSLRPFLEDSIVSVTGHGPEPVPALLLPEHATSGLFDQRLVVADAELLDIRKDQGQHTLLLQAGSLVLTAWLPSRSAGGWRVPAVGAKLRATGVWAVDYSQEPNLEAIPRSFRLVLRSPEDLLVTALPSWWTTERLLALIAVLSICTGAAVTWVWTLRRKVRMQTAVIRRQVEQEAVSEERQRIARDFHDTLQQDLVGVMMQLNAASASRPELSIGAARTLEFARQLLRRSIDGIRATVWDLRFRPLDTEALPTALIASVQARYGRESPVHIKIIGEPRKLPTPVETHLLRIAEEAVVNAVKHSGARTIRMELNYSDSSLSLKVADDGRGFEPESVKLAKDTAHFGLISMHERTEKIGGSLTMRSSPGAGTVVEVEVALERDALDRGDG